MIKILNRICFKIVPGLCLWAFLWILYADTDAVLRSANSAWLAPFTIAAIFYNIAILFWILLGDTENFRPESKKVEESVSPYIQLSTLIFSLLYYFFLFPPSDYFKFLVIAGATYYLGIFFADWLIVAKSEFKGFIGAMQKRAFNETKIFVFVFIPLFIIFSSGTFFVIYKLTYNPAEPNFLISSLPVWVSFFGALFARTR